MGAPSPTPRVSPTGNVLEIGYQCLITFANDTDIDLFEKTVQPPGLEVGDAINITTQHNSLVMTKSPPASLYDVTDGQMTCSYARPVYSQIQSIIGVETTITYTYQDGGTVAVYGFLKSFIPNSQSMDTQPEATVVIVHTNIDPSDGSEAVPVISAAVGTP